MVTTRLAQAKQRVDAVPAWLLHHYPYRETSLIVEAFTRSHGRVSLVARGARRPGSQLRGGLLAFQPLCLSWFGGGELKTLHAAEWQGGLPQLGGGSLICGFYLNELLLKLLPHEDPHERLFDAYALALQRLGADAQPLGPEPALRQFEFTLLAELGFGFHLDRDASGLPIEAKARYHFVPEHGFVKSTLRASGAEGVELLQGGVLLAASRGEFSDAGVMQQTKLLMRQLIGQALGETPLHTRQLLRDLQKL